MMIATFCFLLTLAAATWGHPVARASTPDALLAKARAENLASDPSWLKLLHYETKWLGGYESQVDGAAFFLDPEGKNDPAAELAATLKAFHEPVAAYPDETKAMHARCRFPGRFLWLAKRLDLSQAPKPACARFASWKERIAARSATIVFSSYYLNNPASAYGHTLIRLNQGPSAITGKRTELLDYGVGYAAVMESTNPLLYSVAGVAGWYRGTFTSVPYYYKVREYNDAEARDLWEYDLALTDEQIELLVAHLWELGPTYFDYYYFTENCSYHMLTALEAAAPELELVSRMPWIVIPVDSIRVVARAPALVTGVHYRPSIRAQLEARAAGLTSKETAELLALVEARDPTILSPALTFSERARVLDAGMDALDYRYAREILEFDAQKGGEPPEPVRWKQRFLLARSQIPVQSEELRVEAKPGEQPHLGHGTRRVGVGGGAIRGTGTAVEVSYRFSLHDLLDYPIGYPELGHVELFGFRFRADPSPYVEEVNLFRAVSWSPWSALNRKLSWRAKLGYARPRDPEFAGRGAAVLEAGPGLTTELPLGVIPFAFLDTELDAGGPGFPVRLGVGASLGARLRPWERFGLMTELRGRYFPLRSRPWATLVGVEARAALDPALALALRGELGKGWAEVFGGAYFYY